jgi:uncharacterized membrane protein (Fun14 family)
MLKKVMKIATVIVGPFIAPLAYIEYQRIIQVDWISIQALSQNGITMLTNAVTHISNNFGADHARLMNFQRLFGLLTRSGVDSSAGKGNNEVCRRCIK